MIDGCVSVGTFDCRTGFWRWGRPGFDWRPWLQAWDPIAGASVELGMKDWMLFRDANNVVALSSSSGNWHTFSKML